MEARLAPTADSHQPPELLVHVEGCFEKPPAEPSWRLQGES